VITKKYKGSEKMEKEVGRVEERNKGRDSEEGMDAERKGGGKRGKRKRYMKGRKRERC
jgi:hypothetical protein